MTLTFPLSVGDFWERLKVAPSAPFTLTDTAISSRTDDGQSFQSTRGVPLWTGPVVLAARPNRDARAMQSRIEMMARTGETFLAYDVTAQAPRSDPFGDRLGAASPTVGAINGSDAFAVAIGGLPQGYAISAGDMISIQTASGRLNLVRAVDDVAVASVAGLTPLFRIEPGRFAEVAVGNAVTLVRPLAKFKVEPGSFDPGRQDGVNTSGAGFTMMQVIA
ncbi:MAG: hypothetical protein RQ750_14650 [Roseovarius sp.]|nr:hypothetical protein [Roseovarius sp.]